MALATIVHATGSTYRRPGARYLIPEKGDPVGNLSGGCLEGEVEDLARTVMRSGEPQLALYDLTADDEVVWGWGLGCNGAIEVFVEPADNAEVFADALQVAIERERAVTLATVISSELQGVRAGDRLLLGADGDKQGELSDPATDELVAATARDALISGLTATCTLDVAGRGLRVFFETLSPPLRLLVCGAGHDAIPVVDLAARLGWKVVVVDDRVEFLTAERFPGAAGFVGCEPEVAAHKAGVDDRTYAVVMSHNYLRDRAFLRSFLATDVAYMGMLGPRARLERILEDLRNDGVELTPADLKKIHGPSGLDVGAEGPDEIAVAIVSEVLAVVRERGGGYLRERKGPIHQHREIGVAT